MNKAMKDSTPFNPLTTPEAKARWRQVIDTVQAEMDSVGYETKTREKWATRIKELQSCQ